MRGFVILNGDSELHQVVDALHPTRGLAGRLDGGQEQCDQDRDDGDDHQQLDQGESGCPRVLRLIAKSPAKGSWGGLVADRAEMHDRLFARPHAMLEIAGIVGLDGHKATVGLVPQRLDLDRHDSGRRSAERIG